MRIEAGAHFGGSFALPLVARCQGRYINFQVINYKENGRLFGLKAANKSRWEL